MPMEVDHTTWEIINIFEPESVLHNVLINNRNEEGSVIYKYIKFGRVTWIRCQLLIVSFISDNKVRTVQTCKNVMESFKINAKVEVQCYR